MAKDFSIVARVLLDASGFSTGKDKISKDGKTMEKGIIASNNAIKDSFGSLTNEILPQFGQQFGALGGAIGGVKGAFKLLIPAITTVRTAIISTGIGAIVIAISVAIAGLIGWMKRTDEGSDTMRKAFNVISAVIEVVLTKLALMGSALVKFFSGDFEGAANDIKEAFTGWGKAIKDNIELAKQKDQLQEDHETFMMTYATTRAKIDERITELQLKAREKEGSSATEMLAATKQLAAEKYNMYQLDLKKLQFEVDIAQKQYDTGAKNKETATALDEKQAELITLKANYNRENRETVKLENKLIEQAESLKLKLDDQSRSVTKIKDTFFTMSSIPSLTKMSGQVVDLTTNWKAFEKGSTSALNSVGIFGPPATASLKAMNAQFIDMDKVIDLVGKKTIGVFDGLKLAFKSLNDDFKKNNLKDVFTSFLDATMKAFEDFNKTLLEGANSFAEYGKNIKAAVKKLIGTLIAKGVAAMVSNALESAGSLGPYGFLIAPALAALAGGLAVTAFNSLIPNFASGGVMNSSGLALVGENGPELVNMSKGTQIYNDFQTRNILSNNNTKQFEFVLRGKNLIGAENNYYRSSRGF